MKYHAPAYSEDDDSSADSHGGSGDRRKMTGDCPSQLSDERTELLELQWRDGCPVEQPVHDHRDNEDTSSPGEKTNKTAAGDATAPGEAVEEWWKMWREGESGCAAAAAHGYPQLVDDVSSVNAKAATASVGPRQQTRTTTTTVDETADELWRLWREGQGSSAPQDSSCKNSVLKGEDSVLPSSTASRGSGGAQRHSSEQIDQQCSTLDQAIEYMKSLQQQIQVLSHNGYGMQPLLFPCICSQSSSHTAVPATPAVAPAAPLYPAQPPPAAAAVAAAAPLYQPVPPPQPAAAAADLNPDMVAAAGGAPPPSAVPGLTCAIGTGLAEEMAWSPSEIPFGGCARCNFRRHAFIT